MKKIFKTLLVVLILGFAISSYTGVYAAGNETTTAIPAPTLKKISATAYNKVKLTWNTVQGAASYKVYYKGGTVKKWTLIKSKIGTTSYTHTSSSKYPLVAGTTYSYTVCAVKGTKICSSYGDNVLKVTPKTTAPTLTKTTSVAYNKIKIYWDKVAGASGYYVYRKENGKWKKIGTTTKTYYTHTSSTKYPVTTGKTYTYTVRSYRKVNGKVVSGLYSTKGITGKAIPDTPELVSANLSSTNKVVIRWKKASGATHYKIYRKESGTSYKLVATVKGANLIGYTHTASTEFPMKKGTTYTYTVRAYNSTGKTNGKYDSSGVSVKIADTVSVTEAQVRAKAQAVIAKVTTSSMSKETKLKKCWYYMMAQEFWPSAYPDTTKLGWQRQCAYDYMTKGGGNCYGMAHTFAALAKELGYDPYVIVIPNVHCFVQINGKYWDNMGNKMGVTAKPMSYTSSQISKFEY